MPDTTPTPTPVAPCFICGPDYLTDPATLALTLPSTTDLPAGCECPGCVEARNLLAAAETAATDAPQISPEDSPAYLTALSISHASPVTSVWNYDSPREMIVGLCPSHTTAVTNLITARSTTPTDARCQWCAAIDPAVLAALGVSLTDRRITNLRVANRRGSLSQPVIYRWQHAASVASDFTACDTAGGTQHVCQSCYDLSTECGGCGYTVRDGYGYYCDDCEYDVCQSCWDGTHYGHNDRSEGYDRARYNFAPRQTIPGALGLAGAPGTTVLSTRALGIEIETARGNAQVVIDRERVSAIPVLQAVGTDGSVRGRNPVEYRLLPARGAFVEHALRMMGEWCREAGYEPDGSAGIHMHVDLSQHNAEQVWRSFAALVLLEPVLFSHAAPGRMSSQYCQGYGASNPQIVEQALAIAARSPRYFEPDEVAIGSRYRSVNAHSHSAHQTLEVRVFDSAHDVESVERFTDAAAIIAGAVDFAVSSAWHDYAAAPRTDRTTSVVRLLGAMATAGHITPDTMARACARLDARTLVAA